nr:nucleoside hydrolase-like domain-containing protein [uncultured Draconibacterium sp.]
MKKLIVLYAVLGVFFAFSFQLNAQQKPRTIVTSDGEVDDMDSFIRFLLYTNNLDVEGLVYSSSQWHYKGDGKGTTFVSEMEMTKRIYGERTELRWPGTTWMQELTDKYAKVYPNLIQHDPNYPTPEYLKSIIRVGNIDFEGEMEKVTEGSEFIKNILLDDDDTPVYVQIWGGTNTLARALKSIEEEYKGKSNWEDIYKKVSEKTVIYAVLDQDATYKKYVEPNWPEVRVIYNSAQFWSFAYMWPRVVPESLKPFMEGEWYSENIKFNHGPLLENYYLWGDGQHIAGDPDHTHGSMEEVKKNGRKQYDFISEGDSPSYLFLLNFGLENYDDPTYGGLGGRFKQSESNPYRWEDGDDVTDYNTETGKQESAYPQLRWLKVIQNDFAARADWCVNDYEDANHAPIVEVEINAVLANAGDVVTLSGVATDPDNDNINYKWWNYAEAGTYPNVVKVKSSSKKQIRFRIPDDAKAGQTIHLILEVSDDGNPSLTRFQRVVIQIN